MSCTPCTHEPSSTCDVRVRFIGRLGLATALLATAPSPGTTQQPPVFPAGVETVRVDVVVTDAKGRPVEGLRREDFVVREDGAVQQVVDFEAIGVARAPGPGAAAEPAPTAPGEPPSVPAALPATFLVVFDESHLTMEAARTGRAFVVELFKQVREGDRVTLVAGHDGRWWSGVGPSGAQKVAEQLPNVGGRFQDSSREDLMTPYEAMRVVKGDRFVETVVRQRAQNESDLAFNQSSVDALADQVPLRARALYDDALLQVRRLLDLVATSLELMPHQRGRTTLVLVSGGFIDDAQLAEYRELARRFVRSAVTLYFYDARALASGHQTGAAEAARLAGRSGVIYQRDLFGPRSDELRLQEEALAGDAAGSMRLADETGGFTIRVSDASGLDRLASDARHYYLLGYVPSNTKHDGRLRQIAVEIHAPGTTVRARKAYYAPNEKDTRAASAATPAAAAASARTSATARPEATARYLALAASHRATPRSEDLDALVRIPPRELKKTVAAVNLDAGCAFDCRRAAVVLHTDAALGLLRAGNTGVADEQRTLALELLRGLKGAPDADDFERLFYHTLGDRELDLGRVGDAIALFDALVKEYPQDPDARLARGRADEFGLYLLSLVAHTPRIEQTEMSSSSFELNRYQRTRAGAPVAVGEEAYRRSAIECYREALRLEPKLVEAQLRLGRVLWLDGKVDEAVGELEAVAKSPSAEGRQLAHLLLSRIEDERGRLQEALAHAEAAVAARPLWQSGRVALAELQLRSGNSEEARLTVSQAVVVPDDRASEDGWLRYNLGAGKRSETTLQALRSMVGR
jgi:VWFA-related protein